MVTEILKAIAEEFTGQPMRMLAEFAQFVLLVGIAWVVAIGFGKRRGFILNMLAERRSAVRGELADAAGAEESLTVARTAADERLASAKAEATRMHGEVVAETEAAEKAAQLSADGEAERIIERAHTALANERAQMQADLRDELVSLVSEATRSIMNEALTVAEQRERIEKAIVSSVAGIQSEGARVSAREGAAGGAG